MRQHRYSEEQTAEDRAHPDERDRRVARLVALEGGNAVGDRLDPGERDRAGREPAHQSEQSERPDPGGVELEVAAQLRDLA